MLDEQASDVAQTEVPEVKTERGKKPITLRDLPPISASVSLLMAALMTGIGWQTASGTALIVALSFGGAFMALILVESIWKRLER